MNLEEEKIEERLKEKFAEIKAKETKSANRAMLYTIIPIFVGLTVFGFLMWGVINLEARKDIATKQLENVNSQLNEKTSELAEKTKLLDNTTSKLQNIKIELQQPNVSKESIIESLDGTIKNIKTANTNSITPTPTKTITPIPTIAEGKERWIVISDDGNKLDEAKYEATKANKLGYSKVTVYLRQNAYRTVIEFPSETEAKANLSKLNTLLKTQPQLLNLNKWCPNPKQQKDYFLCSN